jgi:hypothetical protein
MGNRENNSIQQDDGADLVESASVSGFMCPEAIFQRINETNLLYVIASDGCGATLNGVVPRWTKFSTGIGSNNGWAMNFLFVNDA